MRRRELSPLVRLGIWAVRLCSCAARATATMSSFSSEERAAPFTLEYRVFLSE